MDSDYLSDSIPNNIGITTTINGTNIKKSRKKKGTKSGNPYSPDFFPSSPITKSPIDDNTITKKKRRNRIKTDEESNEAVSKSYIKLDDAFKIVCGEKKIGDVINQGGKVGNRDENDSDVDWFINLNNQGNNEDSQETIREGVSNNQNHDENSQFSTNNSQISRISFGSNSSNNDNININDSSDESPILKEKCFFCDYYLYSKDVPSEQPIVKKLYEDIKDQYFNLSSDQEAFYKNIAEYYIENIFYPSKMEGIDVPKMTYLKMKNHFVNHMPDNPAVHFKNQRDKLLKISTVLSNELFYTIPGTDKLITDHDNLKAFFTTTEKHNKAFFVKIESSYLHDPDCFNTKAAGSFLNFGTDPSKKLQETKNNWKNGGSNYKNVF